MLNDLMDRAGGARRIMLGAVGLGVAILILVASRFATAPTWVPAITNAPLQSASELTDRLDQAGIKYKLERGGADILVAEADLAKARVTIAKDGIPGGGRPGLEIFDRPSWGWNDFTQHVNYRRALEGELERTIGRMRGIERAEVHLAISEQAAFRRADERPASASVLLALKQSGAPPAEVVQGIAHLVSSSVDGLAPENVSIHDETGRQWSEPNDAGSLTAMGTKQLRVQQEIEKYLEKKAETLLSQMVGAGNVRVQVAASMNFDRLERTTQSVDPEKQALASEQKAEIVPGAQGGAGSTNVANSYENTKSTETFSGAVGNIKRLTVAVLVNDKPTLPIAAGGDSTGAPCSAPRSAEELARIETLVRSAVGIDSTRGDAVSVVSVSMETPKVTVAPEKTPDITTRIQQFERPVVGTLGVVLAFVLGLLALRALRSPGSAAPRALVAAGAGAGGMTMQMPTAPHGAVMQPAAPKFVFPTANTEVRDRAVASVDQDPEVAARLVKAWIREG